VVGSVICQFCGASYKGSSRMNICPKCAYVIIILRKAKYPDKAIFKILSSPGGIEGDEEARKLVEKVCPLCGQVFIPSSRTAGYCNPCLRVYNLLRRYRGMKIEEIRAVVKAGALDSVLADIEKEIEARQMRAMEEEA